MNEFWALMHRGGFSANNDLHLGLFLTQVITWLQKALNMAFLLDQIVFLSAISIFLLLGSANVRPVHWTLSPPHHE